MYTGVVLLKLIEFIEKRKETFRKSLAITPVCITVLFGYEIPCYRDKIGLLIYQDSCPEYN
jgi:hypothetical protein